MLGEFRRTVATERALQMLLLIFLLGLMPQAARLIANFQHLGFAIAVFVLNLVVCGFGFKTGRFPVFWIAYAVACALSFALLGMTSPIATLLMLATSAI